MSRPHGVLIQSTNAVYSFELEPKEVDLGVLRPDEDASFSFRIVNHDRRPLPIVNLDGSCECVAFTWERGDVAPGRSRTVRTEVKAQNRGSKLLTIYVQANDEKVTTRELPVRYLVQPDLTFEPARADFGRRLIDSAGALEVVVSYVLPRDASPIELAPKLSKEAPVRFRVAAPPAAVERADGLVDVKQRLELVVDTAEPVSDFQTELVFEGDRFRPSRLKISGAVHRGFYLDPDQIHLGVTTVGAARRGTARLLWTREEPRIESIECDPADLTAEAMPEAGARSFRIVVSFAARAAGELDGTVKIRTSLASEPLVLRVKGKVR